MFVERENTIFTKKTLKKMKLLLISLISIFFSLNPYITNGDYIKEIQKWQDTMNLEFKNPEESPLTKEGMDIFESLVFYNINIKYRVEAKFERTPFEPIFGMKTTTSRLPEYKKYGTATFYIDGKEFKLNVYQNQSLINRKEYEDYLFIPYTDLTSGNDSYSGGKYIDLKVTKGEVLIIDFNKSYNPYCAYNHKYSCPVPPKENFLNTRIEAGVKAYNDLANKSRK
jgi:uncharacterized protein (DUF1684 family)